MSQSKRMSLVETLVNVGIGFVLSVLVSLWLYPWYGHSFSLMENVEITAIFTVISIARGYAVRRVFVWVHKHLIDQ